MSPNKHGEVFEGVVAGENIARKAKEKATVTSNSNIGGDEEKVYCTSLFNDMFVRAVS